MTRFSLVPDVEGPDRYDIDWTDLWGTTNPRPICFRNMELDITNGGTEIGPQRCMQHNFGYQYLDTDGRNVEHVQQIKGAP
jgi:hypothetical protein